MAKEASSGGAISAVTVNVPVRKLASSSEIGSL
jgi:hypothetical protein